MRKIEIIKDFIWEKKTIIIVLLTAIGILIGEYLYFNRKKDIDDSYPVLIMEEEKKEIEESNCYVTVDIKGSVKNPGIYQVECEKRVNDVINLAGGINKDADTSIINLGKKVYDEMVIIIYSKKEVNNLTEVKKIEEKKQELCICDEKIVNDACIENVTENSKTVLISINKATKEELMTLSGIGESKANDIIKYREDNGGFLILEDIKNIKGIGDSVFDKIKEYISL